MFMFICEIWLFDWYFPQFCTFDMSVVRISRSVSEGPFDFEITRVDCTLIIQNFLIKTGSYQGFYNCETYPVGCTMIWQAF